MARIRFSAPRLLPKALVLSCLALLSVGLSGPARGDGWSDPVVTASGTWSNGVQTGQAWSRNNPNVALGPNLAQTQGTITVTRTWVGPGTCPTKCYIKETASASASATPADEDGPFGSVSADDGLGDAPTCRATSAVSQGTHLFQVDSSSGTITRSVTVSATGSGTGLNCSAGASFSWDFVTVTVAGNSTVDTAGWDPANPRFFSGTNCSAAASTDFDQSLISYTKLLVDGTQVKEYPDPTDPSVTPPLSVVFDSTHFADGSAITIEYQIQDTAGDPLVVKDVTANAYNEGYLLNDTAFTSGNGLTALTDVGARLGGMNHTTISSEASKDYINSALPTYTVFYAYTHGAVDAFGHTAYGDGSAQTTNYYDNLGQPWTDHYVLSSEVLASPNAKDLYQPPYNMAYVDGCQAGEYSDLRDAFLAPAPPYGYVDQSLVGWTTDVGDSLHNVNWTNRVWQHMEDGYTISESIDYATNNGGAPDADYVGDGMAKAEPQGDTTTKLHGVYGIDGLNMSK